MRRQRHLVLGLLLASACGEPEKPLPPPTPAAKAAPAGSPVATAQKAPETSKDSLLVEARKRPLTKEDFTESDTNRDPFRSYLSTFAVQVVVNKQHKIVLEKFALDELKLIAIVTGEGAARAMFVDPGGQGVTVGRGDHVSKADAVITRIAPDRVFFRIEEEAGSEKPRVTERVLELHAGEAATQ